jgi:hypothetical protein
MDITQLILDDHQEQRRLFAMLEVHAEAAEQFFYPELLQLGKGAGDKDTPEAETEDAIEDHNEIRDAVATVADHRVGSNPWFDAVATANKANGDHMAEEEREGLTDFRRNADLALRNTLAVAFAPFEAKHVTGVKAVDKDPQDYIDEHE